MGFHHDASIFSKDIGKIESNYVCAYAEDIRRRGSESSIEDGVFQQAYAMIENGS